MYSGGKRVDFQSSGRYVSDMKNSSNSDKAINLVFCDPAVRRLAVSSLVVKNSAVNNLVVCNPLVCNAKIFGKGIQDHTSAQENWWWQNRKRSVVGMV